MSLGDNGVITAQNRDENHLVTCFLEGIAGLQVPRGGPRACGAVGDYALSIRSSGRETLFFFGQYILDRCNVQLEIGDALQRVACRNTTARSGVFQEPALLVAHHLGKVFKFVLHEPLHLET